MKRVLSALLIFLLSFSAISMIVTVIVFHTVFPRSDDISEFAYTYTQMEDLGYPYQRVAFPSGENTLSGYVYAPDDPKALVVIASGFGDSGACHLAEMTAFVDSGYSVLCYDATGVGESEGSGKIGLTQPSRDLKAALSYIDEDKTLSELPILLYGHSAGGYAAASCMDHEDVKAAVIICAFDDPVHLMRESARQYVGILADIEYPFLLLENRLLFGSGQSASACIEQASAPVAVYEGAEDERVPVSQRLSSRLRTEDEAVSIRICDEANRSGHSGVWLSESALSYRSEHTAGAVVDPKKANDLDPDFMSSVLTFYHKALPLNGS